MRRFADRRSSPYRHHGLTLIELIAAIAMLAFIATIGILSFAFSASAYATKWLWEVETGMEAALRHAAMRVLAQ
ncbi:hypothetical protein FIU83_15930 [Halomonas sp. THAF5a]|uniref:prepilin-type N-terminal cleavage/methylation domain-containing protein n=1 Tax=Halomonas sp. THAF5a TaxID=2587844 RepID=UPI0012678DC1|nr:prepilin-type N-terminal cleavage/methylation domain-containing protein [Halomonas sp. THAF5a]QFU03130.1 hypothetical protein FIU83_15930 [Halomonas sp. THAF5a]